VLGGRRLPGSLGRQLRQRHARADRPGAEQGDRESASRPRAVRDRDRRRERVGRRLHVRVGRPRQPEADEGRQAHQVARPDLGRGLRRRLRLGDRGEPRLRPPHQPEDEPRPPPLPDARPAAAGEPPVRRRRRLGGPAVRNPDLPDRRPPRSGELRRGRERAALGGRLAVGRLGLERARGHRVSNRPQEPQDRGDDSRRAEPGECRGGGRRNGLRAERLRRHGLAFGDIWVPSYGGRDVYRIRPG
jgi:hypothetical protein